MGWFDDFFGSVGDAISGVGNSIADGVDSVVSAVEDNPEVAALVAAAATGGAGAGLFGAAAEGASLAELGAATGGVVGTAEAVPWLASAAAGASELTLADALMSDVPDIASAAASSSAASQILSPSVSSWINQIGSGIATGIATTTIKNAVTGQTATVRQGSIVPAGWYSTDNSVGAQSASTQSPGSSFSSNDLLLFLAVAGIFMNK